MEAKVITALKPLPFSVTKKQLVDMYQNQMSENFIKKEINTIIQDRRRLPKDKAPKVMNVLHIEFMEFVSLYGVPKGYQKT